MSDTVKLTDDEVMIIDNLPKDHVSKSELREWCEARKLRWRNGMFSVKGHVVSEEYDLLLEKFCKGEK